MKIEEINDYFEKEIKLEKPEKEKPKHLRGGYSFIFARTKRDVA